MLSRGEAIAVGWLGAGFFGLIHLALFLMDLTTITGPLWWVTLGFFLLMHAPLPREE